ncbi:HAD family hydrolase [Salinirubrum litoreum]|uniref:HAD family hydrolase n=1 Tax=Salinirubrum litoreum TaxID=1126234 RepID=A0ABD5RAV6_9EURY
MTYAAVVFDLDDTLCRHDQSEEEVYVGAFERAGIDLVGEPTDLWQSLEGAPDPDDTETYLARGFRRVLSQYDADSVATDATAGDTDPARALARGFSAVVDHRRVSFRPGAEAVLDRARETAQVALLTNGPERRQAIKLDALGIADAFDSVVFAGDMDNRKPHRDPFDRVVRELDVAADRTLYVGDSLEYDVGGAQGAGLDAAWTPDGDDPNDVTDDLVDTGDFSPEFVVPRLADLRVILDEGPTAAVRDSPRR